MIIMFKKVVNFWKNELWSTSCSDMKGFRLMGIKFLRCINLSFRGFLEDSCQLKASALTFFTLLSVVPVLAMAFGVAKGFGMEKLLKEELLKNLPGQEEILLEMINYAYTLLASTGGGLIASVGIVILFWTVIKLLGNIEFSFNEIWGVKKQRTLGRKFSDYLSVMLLCPFLFIISSSLMVFVNSQVTVLLERFEFVSYFGEYIRALLKLSSFVILWIIFTFIYMFMPNTKVKVYSALIGGIITTIAYSVLQHVYINFQVGVSKYNAIYGSFAILPLFLVWLQMNWYVLLYGAEVAFAAQNMDMYEFESECRNISRRHKEAVILSILSFLFKTDRNDNSSSCADIASHMKLPIRLVREVVSELLKAKLIIEVLDENGHLGHKIICSTGEMKISDILHALHTSGGDSDFAVDEVRHSLELINSFYERIHSSERNKKLSHM